MIVSYYTPYSFFDKLLKRKKMFIKQDNIFFIEHGGKNIGFCALFTICQFMTYLKGRQKNL